MHERGTASGDHAFLNGGTRCRKRIFDAMLLLFEFGLGRGTDLDHRNATGELRKTLLQLLAIEVRIGVLDLLFDHLDAALDVGRFTRAIDDRGLFFRHGHALGLTELIRSHFVELEAELF